MTKNPLTTSDQLRALMRSHIETSAAIPKPTAPAPVMVKAVNITSQGIPLPAANPIPQARPTPFRSPAAPLSPRYSLRLLPPEILKINSIINATLHNTGERVTLTDILRVALGRLGDSSSIGPEEMKSLRSTDGRRTKSE